MKSVKTTFMEMESTGKNYYKRLENKATVKQAMIILRDIKIYANAYV